MKTVNTIFGPFNSDLAQKFLTAYNENKDREQFLFKLADGQEHPILTKLAKYMIEFLKNEKLL